MTDDAQSDQSQPQDANQADDEPFRELVEFEWTEKAYHMLGRGELRGEAISSEEIVRSRVWGPCPRCGHALDDRQTHTAVIGIMGTETRGGHYRGQGSGESGSPFEVDVSCGCGDKHFGAPEGTTGCGVSFRVALALQLAERNKTP